MNLLFHCLRKDVAALRWWFIAWALACFTHFALRLAQLWHGENTLPAIFRSTTRPDHLAILLLVTLIVPQIVQLDSPARPRAFWKTLPLSRWRVMSEKLTLVAIAFVLFPLLLESVYFAMAGFGGAAFPAVGAWLARLLPYICVAAGAAALARDLRVTLVLAALGAFALTKSAGTPSTWLLAAVALFIVCGQYGARARHGWLICGAALALGLPLLRHPAQKTAPAPSAPPLLAQTPAGLELSIDPLPEQIRFEDTRSHGPLCTIYLRLAQHHLPAGVFVKRVQFTDCQLALPNETIRPANAAELEDNVNSDNSGAPKSLREIEQLQPEDRLVFAAPAFPLSREKLYSAPIRLEGKVRVELGRIHSLGEFPFHPGIVWSSGLHELRVTEAERLSAVGKRQLQFGLELQSTTRELGLLPHFAMSAITVLLRHDENNGFEISLTGAAPVAAGPALYKTDAPSTDHASPHIGTVQQFILPEATPADSSLALYKTAAPPAGYAFPYNSVNQEGVLRTLTDPARKTDLTRGRVWESVSGSLSLEPQNLLANVPSLDAERLSFENGNAGHWKIVVEQTDEVGTIAIPVHLGPVGPAPAPWFSLANQARRDAFAEELDHLILRNPEDGAEVDDYLDRLFVFTAYAPRDLADFYRNTLILKLLAVGSGNLDRLIRHADVFLAGQHESSTQPVREPYEFDDVISPRRSLVGSFSRRLRRYICDLADETHKDAILKGLSPHLDLLSAVQEQGWQAEALPIVARYAEAEPVSDSFLNFLADCGGPIASSALLAQARMGNLSVDTLERAALHSDFPEREAVASSWSNVPSHFRKYSMLLRLFAKGCKFGDERMPRDLFFLLHMDVGIWRRTWDNEENEVNVARKSLAELFSRCSDCPPNPTEALAWLTQRSDRLRFNPATHRYESR